MHGTTTGDPDARHAAAAPSHRVGATGGRNVLLPPALARSWLPLLLLAAAIAATALARPIIAGVDTPALAAAWEILRDRDWLTWRDMGGAAATLPPLLPWLVALAWTLLGVGVWWAWTLCAIGLLAGAVLTRRLALRLWPQRADAAPLASWTFTGSAGVLLLGPAIAPETIGLAFAGSGLLGLAIAADGRFRGWLLFAPSLALLLLTVGPAAFTVLLGPALLGPAWKSPSNRRIWIAWYLSLVGATVVAIVPLLILLSCGTATLGPSSVWVSRMDGPSLVPLLVTPAILYPWPFWPRFWRSARRQSSPLADAGIRLCLIALALPLAGFVASGAEARRVLLIVPPAAILIARLLAGRLPGRADFHAGLPGLPLILLALAPVAINTVPWAQLSARAHQFTGIEALPIWPTSVGVGGTLVLLGGVFLLIQATPRLMLSRTAQVAILPMILAAAVNLEMNGALGRAFDLDPVASRLGILQAQGAPVAVLGIDPSAYAFPGRLELPLPALASAQEALAWADAHPDGVIIASFRGSVLHLPREPSYVAPQGSGWVAFWPARIVLETDGAVLDEWR